VQTYILTISNVKACITIPLRTNNKKQQSYIVRANSLLYSAVTAKKTNVLEHCFLMHHGYLNCEHVMISQLQAEHHLSMLLLIDVIAIMDTLRFSVICCLLEGNFTATTINRALALLIITFASSATSKAGLDFSNRGIP